MTNPGGILDRAESVRKRVASNSRTRPETLALLANDKSVAVRERVALQSTDDTILALLAGDPSEKVRAVVVESHDITVEVLLVLCADTEPLVRAKVATRLGLGDPENLPTTLQGLLQALASHHRDWEARNMAAEHPATPETILLKLATDEDEDVRWGLTFNEAATPAVLACLADDPVGWIREALARHPHTPPEVLERLVCDGNETLWPVVAENPQTPKHLRLMMAVKLMENDEEEYRGRYDTLREALDAIVDR